jgi:hypothetical protein
MTKLPSERHYYLNICWKLLHLLVSCKLLFLESYLVFLAPYSNGALERSWPDVETICIVERITKEELVLCSICLTTQSGLTISWWVEYQKTI